MGISENETQLIIIDGIDGWILTLVNNSFNKIVDPGFIPGTHVLNIDGFFVENEPNSGRFRVSGFGLDGKNRDGFIWDALDYYTAEGSPDNLISIGKLNNELWLFGGKTTEIWYDTGDTFNGQFKRVNQGFIDIGIDAPWSVATSGNTIFWLGGSSQGHGIVWQSQTYIPQRISTHAIEYIIGKLTRTVDAVAFCYQQEGHFFYQITFPSDELTLVYDMKTKMWHKRGYYYKETGDIGRHRAQCHAFWNGKNYVGDYANAKLYELDLDTFTDNGEIIRMVRVGPHIHKDRKRLFFHEFELDIERGVGLTTGQGSNPKIMLQMSDDGGRTWGNEIEMNMGKIGEYKMRAHKHHLGHSRDRVFKVSITDPVKCVLMSANADIEMEGA